MFIRFISGAVDENSHLAAGLFSAACDFHESGYVPRYEYDVITELLEWFESNLRSPFDYLQENSHYDSAVCWFKSTAHEHLAKAWELVEILERNDIPIWTIKSQFAGHIFYEDQVQVLALPYRQLKARLC
jgi:hypothetical protein